jgi:hypothetical protein
MKLYRYLLASFRPDLAQPWEKRKAEVGRVTIELGTREKDSDGGDLRIIAVSIALDKTPDLDAHSRILIPVEERIACETAGEHIVNLISVLESCSRVILSPNMCVALAPENQAERDSLEGSAGILPVQKSESAARWNVEWTPEIGSALSDRMAKSAHALRHRPCTYY